MSELSPVGIAGIAMCTLALLKLIKPVLYFNGILKTRYRPPTYTRVDDDEVAADLRQYLGDAASGLSLLGFEPLAWVREEPAEYSEFGTTSWYVLEHPALGCYAWAGIGQLGKGCRVEFVAAFEDGFRLLTLNGDSKLAIAEYPNAEVVDPAQPDVAALWSCFEARLHALLRSRHVCRSDADAMVAAHQQWHARVYAHWLARGALQWSRDPGLLEVTAAHGLRYAWRLHRHSAHFFQFVAERVALRPADGLISEEVRAFRRTRELGERRNARFGVGPALLLSGILFAISMAFRVEPAEVGLLVLVLLIHELGHYLAMRALGYRDTALFFIPFLGAAARGVKRDTRLHEEVIVLLAGPVPGIMLAGALVGLFPAVREYELTRDFVQMLLIINLLNLLPVTPLDGGRVLQLIFNNPRPWFEVGFRLVGALALLALGVFAGDGLLIGLALLLMAGLPAARRSAQAERHIRARGPIPVDEGERLHLLFSELRAHQPSLAPASRYAVALPISQRLRYARLSMPRSLGWTVGYLGLIGAGMLMLPHTMPEAPSAPPRAQLNAPRASCPDGDRPSANRDPDALRHCAD